MNVGKPDCDTDDQFCSSPLLPAQPLEVQLGQDAEMFPLALPPSPLEHTFCPGVTGYLPLISGGLGLEQLEAGFWFPA